MLFKKLLEFKNILSFNQFLGVFWYNREKFYYSTFFHKKKLGLKSWEFDLKYLTKEK